MTIESEDEINRRANEKSAKRKAARDRQTAKAGADDDDTWHGVAAG